MKSRLSQIGPAKLRPRIRVVDKEQAMFSLRSNGLLLDPLRSILKSYGKTES